MTKRSKPPNGRRPDVAQTEPLLPYPRDILQTILDVSPVERTLDAALAAGIELFCNAADEPFVRIPGQAKRDVWPLRSPRVRHWLAGLCWKQCRSLLPPRNIENLLNVLEGKAWESAPQPIAAPDAWKLAE